MMPPARGASAACRDASAPAQLGDSCAPRKQSILDAASCAPVASCTSSGGCSAAASACNASGCASSSSGGSPAVALGSLMRMSPFAAAELQEAGGRQVGAGSGASSYGGFSKHSGAGTRCLAGARSGSGACAQLGGHKGSSGGSSGVHSAGCGAARSEAGTHRCSIASCSVQQSTTGACPQARVHDLHSCFASELVSNPQLLV